MFGISTRSRLEALLLVAAIGSFASIALAAQPTKRKTDPERGLELWSQSCWMCHGRDARGAGPASASLPAPPPSLPERLDGQELEIFVNRVQEGRGPMPGFADGMDPRDTRRVLQYIANLGKSPTEETPPRPSPDVSDDDARGAD
jgi:mono/diheme cytochrome c family protein